MTSAIKSRWASHPGGKRTARWCLVTAISAVGVKTSLATILKVKPGCGIILARKIQGNQPAQIPIDLGCSAQFHPRDFPLERFSDTRQRPHRSNGPHGA